MELNNFVFPIRKLTQRERKASCWRESWFSVPVFHLYCTVLAKHHTDSSHILIHKSTEIIAFNLTSPVWLTVLLLSQVEFLATSHTFILIHTHTDTHNHAHTTSCNGSIQLNRMLCQFCQY